ncbi:hypothetical protein [Cellulomonas sp.]|uniref:hypothetical protein n=1 Tax=Cellulomonas sp. TaxID=40001 RepID=UPI001B0B6252|nr:hypothetical protein [Cellulomonas sp.]MBO9555622.1 hypothetical protein [Cellulomonas sp.]
MSEIGESPQARGVETLEELVQLLDLAAVRFYQLSATWDDTGDYQERTEDGPSPELSTETSGSDDFAGEFRTAFRKRREGIDYRVSVSVPHANGELLADAAAMYVSPEPFDVSPEVLCAFGDMVAAMTVLPYLRQAVMDLSVRVTPEEVVVLPIIPRGVITFGGEPGAVEDPI